jgi:imidazolonepropionase-like amidohydrolase
MNVLPNVLKSLLLSVAVTTANAGGHTGQPEAEPEVSRTLIRNVSVWDGTSDTLSPAQNVLVENNLIKAIGKDAGSNDDATTVIDGAGRVLMPGIIDAHAHLALSVPPDQLGNTDPGYMAAISVKAAEIYLMRGWTTVRDIGGPSQGLAKAIDEGIVPGPRVYPSAMIISQTSGHGDLRQLNDPHPNMGGQPNQIAARYKLLADGPAEVRRAVRESLRLGAVQIKVMAGGGISSEYDPIDTVQYSEEELRAAVESAADWHTYVAVHAYTDEAVNRALDAGVKVIEHGHLLSPKTIKRIKSEGAYLSSQSFGFVRQYIKPGQTEGAAGKAASVMEGVDTLMSTARDIGLPVAFGTDTFGSLRAYNSGQTEFGYRLRWFSSAEILKQATGHNAKLLELTGPRNPYQEGPLGVISEGAYADLLIVEGNPLEDVTLLEAFETNIKLIMKDGIIYKNTL